MSYEPDNFPEEFDPTDVPGRPATIAKYRDDRIPDAWFLTEFTMEQVEHRLEYLEVMTTRLRAELDSALRERDKFQAQIELALDQREDALRERDEWKARAEKAEESLAAESLLHDLTRMACDKLRGELEECKQRKGKAVAYRTVTEAENTRLKAEMRGMVRYRKVQQLLEEAIDHSHYLATKLHVERIAGIFEYLADRASRASRKEGNPHA